MRYAASGIATIVLAVIGIYIVASQLQCSPAALIEKGLADRFPQGTPRGSVVEWIQFVSVSYSLTSGEIDPHGDKFGDKSVDELAGVTQADIGSVMRVEFYLPQSFPRSLFHVDEILRIYFFFNHENKLIRFWPIVDERSL
jgi:hypothetical protein